MGRLAKNSVTLADGRTVGYGFKLRAGIIRIQFPDPARPDRYLELSTGSTTKADAHTAAANLIRKAYSPAPAAAPAAAGWDACMAALPADLRDRSAEAYRSIVGILRAGLPGVTGPGGVTVELAKRFRAAYGSDTFARSDKPDARRYKRSPKTVENAVRRLSGFWGHLIEAGYATENPWAKVSRPTVPKRPVSVPTEELVAEFMAYLDGRYPGWDLFRLFVTVKALAGCRTSDLCQVRSGQLRGGVLVIAPDQDKTHRERTVPLPPDVVASLERVKGPTWLWESYVAAARTHRRGTRNRADYSPKTFASAVVGVFRAFNKSRPGRPRLTPHAFRRRAITRMVALTQSVDQTAQAIGIDPATARRYYLDAKSAIDGAELLRRAAEHLRPGS